MLKVKKVHEDARIPFKAHLSDAGFDLFSVSQAILKPGQRALIKTGVAIALPEGYEAQVRPRSGMALKHGITVLNAPGTIDEEYRGELGVVLINHGDKDFAVVPGDKIAQLILSKVEHLGIAVVEELSDTERGGQGFGSTGR
jgi:dUTP pyrophosphatase